MFDKNIILNKVSIIANKLGYAKGQTIENRKDVVVTYLKDNEKRIEFRANINSAEVHIESSIEDAANFKNEIQSNLSNYTIKEYPNLGSATYVFDISDK